MTDKELKNTLTCWIQRDNPKFKLLPADGRLGTKYAVGEDSGNTFETYTPYLPLNELEQYLQGIYHAKEYLSHTK